MIVAVADRTALTIRAARAADVTAMDELIVTSARVLGRGYYPAAETEAAIAHVFGVDSDLIDDGTYFLVEEEGRPLACGGWSKRRTLFGGDRCAVRDPAPLDPVTDAARIRAFFVDPSSARRGLGSMMLRACETAAVTAGFKAATLMATRPGVPFYAARGYVAEPAVMFDLNGTPVAFVPMSKPLVAEKPS